MDDAREKAEALNNSRPLDVWRVSEYPEAQRVVDHIYREIDDAGLVSQRFTDKWRAAVRVEVLDLYVAYVSAPTMFIGYSRNRNTYKQGTRYGALFLSGRIFPKVVGCLADHGYIEDHLGVHATSKQSRTRRQGVHDVNVDGVRANWPPQTMASVSHWEIYSMPHCGMI